MCSQERLRLVGGLVICKMDLERWYCGCLAGRWSRVDFLGGVFVQVRSGVGCVVLCCVSFVFGFC